MDKIKNFQNNSIYLNMTFFWPIAVRARRFKNTLSGMKFRIKKNYKQLAGPNLQELPTRCIIGLLNSELQLDQTVAVDVFSCLIFRFNAAKNKVINGLNQLKMA